MQYTDNIEESLRILKINPNSIFIYKTTSAEIGSIILMLTCSSWVDFIIDFKTSDEINIYFGLADAIEGVRESLSTHR